MLSLYGYCFWGGLLLALLAGGVNALFHFLHMDLHFDAGGGSPFPLKAVTIGAFCIVFGSVGLMRQTLGLSGDGAAAAALLAGLGAAAAMYRFVVVPLYRMENTSTHTHDQVIGQKGRIVSAVLEDGFGTLSYCINGNTLSAPAREERGRRVEQGQAVVIARVEGNVFFVRTVLDPDG